MQQQLSLLELKKEQSGPTIPQEPAKTESQSADDSARSPQAQQQPDHPAESDLLVQPAVLDGIRPEEKRKPVKVYTLTQEAELPVNSQG